MTPRVAGRGHSFKGAGLYYFHDKEASTDERVAWTHTHNIPTNDPDKAMKWMAWTATHSDELKAQNGISTTGRNSTNGSVYTYSLAWHPEEAPEKKNMLEAALETLGVLGLKDHEAVFVAHNDTAHSHVHVIANLVHPETGKTANVYRDHLTLSKWAEAYEKEHGVYCEQRIKNNEQRDQGEYVKHREEKHERAEQIEQLYNQADSGQAFAASLEEAGYTLAKGNRRAFVLVDEAGSIYSLSRQLKGQRAADISAKLSDIDRESLQDAKTLSSERQRYYRDDYEINRQNEISDAGIEYAKEIDQDEKEQRRFAKTYRSYAAEIDPVLERERAADRQRKRKEAELEEYYREEDKKAELLKAKAELTKYQGIKGQVLKGRKEELEHKIWALEKTLEDIERYKNYERAKMENKIAESDAGKSTSGGPDREKGRNPWLPEWLQDRAANDQAQTKPEQENNTRNRGPDFDYEP